MCTIIISHRPIPGDRHPDFVSDEAQVYLKDREPEEEQPAQSETESPNRVLVDRGSPNLEAEETNQLEEAKEPDINPDEIDFYEWRKKHHLFWIKKVDKRFPGWDEYKHLVFDETPSVDWRKRKEPPRKPCRLKKRCLHNAFTPNLRPKKESKKVIGWCAHCKVHLHGVCFDEWHRLWVKDCPIRTNLERALTDPQMLNL